MDKRGEGWGQWAAWLWVLNIVNKVQLKHLMNIENVYICSKVTTRKCWDYYLPELNTAKQ